MPAEVVIRGTSLQLARRSDVAVALRLAAHVQRRIAEDDWRPYRSRKDAVQAWTSAAPTAQGHYGDAGQIG